MTTQTLERRGDAARTGDSAGSSASGRAAGASGARRRQRPAPRSSARRSRPTACAPSSATPAARPCRSTASSPTTTRTCRHILVRHEENAALAADGYARATGFPGVCLATSGPGATNLLTGIATAMMDSVPLLALTGQVATGVIGTQAFQEVDIVGMARPVVKAALPGPHARRRPRPRRRGVPDHARRPARPRPARSPERRADGHGDRRGAAAGRGARRRVASPTSARDARPGRRAARPRRAARSWRSGAACCWPARWTLVTALAERTDTPVVSTLLGIGGDARVAPADVRDGRHARHRRRQHGAAPRRPDRRRRHALRRPLGRPGRRLRARGDHRAR